MRSYCINGTKAAAPTTFNGRSMSRTCRPWQRSTATAQRVTGGCLSRIWHRSMSAHSTVGRWSSQRPRNRKGRPCWKRCQAHTSPTIARQGSSTIFPQTLSAMSAADSSGRSRTGGRCAAYHRGAKRPYELGRQSEKAEPAAATPPM